MVTNLDAMQAGAVDLSAVMAQRQVEETLAAASERGAAATSYAVKAGVHLWVIAFVHQVSDEALAVLESQPPALSEATLIRTPAIACMLCGQPYAPVFAKRRCPAGKRQR